VAETCSTRVKTDVLKVALKTVILSVKVFFIWNLYTFILRLLIDKFTRFVNINLERVWEKVAVPSPGALSHDMHGRSEESHEKFQTRKPVAGPR
jgi:hypothetical protein